jgi:ADP-ribose pyrophosphatase YjhB (NUDIX family)
MEKKIIHLFLTNHKLRFNEIEKKIKERSNKLDYHLKRLIDKKIIEKEKDYYKLTENSEYLIPYVSEKNAVLPVVLILIGNNKKAFLYKRTKRPYENLLSLPGGRILLGESINESVKRIMKEKHGINIAFEKINSVSIEHLKKGSKIINSFLLIFINAKTKEKIDFVDVDKYEKDIIKSDYNLIKRDYNKKININIISSKIE